MADLKSFINTSSDRLKSAMGVPVDRIKTIQGSLLNQMQSIKSLMAFWSDGTLNGSQLTDLSGNNRHATVSDNIISDSGGELGSVLATWNAHAQIVVSNSDEQAHSGTKSFKCAITGASTVRGMRYQYFRTRPGEVVNYSFWVYRVTNAGLNIQVLKGDGTVGYQSLNATPTLNTWVQYSGSFTDTVGGGTGEIRAYVSSGDMTFYFDDLSITITGKANLGVTMANDAALKAIDTNNLFFTAGGIPKTVRSDTDPTLNNLKLFTGGSLKYVFVPDIPTVETRKILYDNFQDHNYLFDSCEIVKTVGAGKDYATIQAAIDSCTAGTLTNRYRIDIYDSLSITTVAQYAKNYPSAGFYCLFATDKAFVYLSGVSDITIEGTIEENATDTQVGNTRLIDVTQGGIRNIVFKKTNGAYLLHHDYASSSFVKIVNCEFHLYDMDEIIAYRIANSLSLPTVSQGGKATLGMGMATPGEVFELINCKASGIVPLTNHGGHASGTASHLFLYNCEMTSMPYYSAWCNPTSTLLNSMELTTTPGGTVVDSIAQIMKSTFTVPATISDAWTVTTK